VKNITDWRLEVDLSQPDWRWRRYDDFSQMHTRRIGLATRNQSALFMMSINWYWVKCVLYSVDSTASQQPASLQLQDIEVEDTSNDSTFTWIMLHLTVRTWTISNYH